MDGVASVKIDRCGSEIAPSKKQTEGREYSRRCSSMGAGGGECVVVYPLRAVSAQLIKQLCR